MATNRDEFTKSTIDKAAKRVGYRCSCPNCRVATVGPSEESNSKASIIGEASHICAAAPGGPRYDPSMTPEERKDISNCIWLCKNHARLIDTDAVKYTVKVLRGWKKDAEAFANAELGSDKRSLIGGERIIECQPLTVIPVKVDLIGRDDDVSDIKNNMQCHNIVTITSAGGVGKSAVAAAICNAYRFNTQIQNIQFRYVAWITSTGSLQTDLCAVDIPVDISDIPDDQKHKVVSKWLKAPGNATLLIIDNMDIPPTVEEQKILNSFSGSTRVLITSRAECNAFYQYSLHEINDQAAICLLYRHYIGHNIPFDILETRDDFSIAKRILDAMHSNNALLIELIGKMAFWENKELSEILMVLGDGTPYIDSELSIETAHAEFRGTDSEKDRNLTMQEQIRRLYKMSELSPEQSKIMSFFAVFPPGMKVYHKIPSWCGFSNEDLRWLMRRGWVKKEEDNYYIHPIIKQSVELQNRDDGNSFNIADYDVLIEELINTEQYLPKNLVYSKYKERAEIPKLFCGMMERENRAGILAFELCKCVASLFYREGRFVDSINSLVKALGVIEIAHLEIPGEEADVYESIGIMCYELFEFEESLVFLKKALAIKQKLYSDDDLNMASIYNDLAEAYTKLLKYEDAESYFNKAIQIYKEWLGENNLSTINTIDNMANMYGDWGKYEQALYYHKKALRYYEKECGSNSIETAIAYNNVGLTYHKMGDNENAKAYLEKCLSIRKRLLREGHPHTLVTLTNLLDVYRALGDQDAYLRTKEVIEMEYETEGGK